MRCSSCGEHVPEVYDFCLQCGFPASRQRTTELFDSDARSTHPQSLHGTQSRNMRPLVVMLIAGGLVIAGIGLIVMLSNYRDTESTEQAEVDSPSSTGHARPGNGLRQTNNDEDNNQRPSPLLPGTPSLSPQTADSPNVNDPQAPSIVNSGRLVPSSFFVPARRYYFMKFNIPARGSMRVVGSFRASGGGGNDIEVMITDETGFKNFANKQGVQTYYNSGKLSIGDINVGLRPGTYYIIFNNNFSLLSNKTITAEIVLKD